MRSSENHGELLSLIPCSNFTTMIREESINPKRKNRNIAFYIKYVIYICIMNERLPVVIDSLMLSAEQSSAIHDIHSSEREKTSTFKLN